MWSLFTRPRSRIFQMTESLTRRSSTPCSYTGNQDAACLGCSPRATWTGAGQGRAAAAPCVSCSHKEGHGPHSPRSGLSSATALAADPQWRRLQGDSGVGVAEHVWQCSKPCLNDHPCPNMTDPSPDRMKGPKGISPPPLSLQLTLQALLPTAQQQNEKQMCACEGEPEPHLPKVR